MNFKVLSLAFGIFALSGVAVSDTVTTPTPSSTKSTYNWTGAYVGGFVGGATGSDVSNSPSLFNDDGSSWNAPGTANNNYSNKASFIGGGTVGYNWQIGETPYLVGLEGEYGYLSQKGGKTDPNAAAYNSAHTGENDNSQSSTSIGADYGYGLVGGRLGYALDRLLIYIKSGAVFTTVNANWSDTNYDFNGTSNKATTTGYALGAGFEYAMPFKYFTNVTIKTEYLYFGIPTHNTINANDSTPPIYCCITTTQTTSGIHTAKIGVNYKFW
ncbi:MAG: outer membrane beta-barrel protein [Methylococcales bacterium]|nr:outer membrane beta-barrel protein [Methylococcales bacterium]